MFKINKTQFNIRLFTPDLEKFARPFNAQARKTSETR